MDIPAYPLFTFAENLSLMMFQLGGLKIQWCIVKLYHVLQFFRASQILATTSKHLFGAGCFSLPRFASSCLPSFTQIARYKKEKVIWEKPFKRCWWNCVFFSVILLAQKKMVGTELLPCLHQKRRWRDVFALLRMHGLFIHYLSNLIERYQNGSI